MGFWLVVSLGMTAIHPLPREKNIIARRISLKLSMHLKSSIQSPHHRISHKNISLMASPTFFLNSGELGILDLSLPGPSREGYEGKRMASRCILRRKTQRIEDLRTQALLKHPPSPGM